MAKMIGKKALYRICVCRDCGNLSKIECFRRRMKLREERQWKREMRDLWRRRN